MKKFFRWFWRHKKISAILIVILIAGFFLLQRQNGNGEFETATSERGDVAEEMILPGAIAADEHAKLAFPSSGRISWINVAEGDEVKKDQSLAKLDTVVLNSALQRARADYRAAEANALEVLDEVKDHDDDETFAQKNTRTAAEVARDKAYDAMVAAEQNLRDATLVSPFDGLVTYVAHPFTGVNVLATETQIEVINPETIYFVVAADQSEVVDISEGESVSIILDANDEKLAGVVTHISYTTVPGEVGSVYGVKAKITGLSSDFVYRVGMTGDAHFTLQEKKNVVYVPADFVKSDSEGDYVLINKGKEKAYIKVGLEGEERTEVIEGVEEGVLIYD